MIDKGDKLFYTVYKTTNLINGKIYVGVHGCNDVEDSYLGSGHLILKAIKKYGKHNFKKEILSVFDNIEDAFRRESEIVDLDFVSQAYTYNLMTGGGVGRTVSEETRRKLSEASRGRNSYWYGREITDEHRKNLSIAKSGKNHPMYGVSHSDEAKRRIGLASSMRTGHKWSPEMHKLFQGPQDVLKCDHCDKSGGYAAMWRWHFDNCKYKKGNEHMLEDDCLTDSDICIINKVCLRRNVLYEDVMSEKLNKIYSHARQECYYELFNKAGHTKAHIARIMNKSRRPIRFGISQHEKRIKDDK